MRFVVNHDGLAPALQRHEHAVRGPVPVRHARAVKACQRPHDRELLLRVGIGRLAPSQFVLHQQLVRREVDPLHDDEPGLCVDGDDRGRNVCLRCSGLPRRFDASLLHGHGCGGTSVPLLVMEQLHLTATSRPSSPHAGADLLADREPLAAHCDDVTGEDGDRHSEVGDAWPIMRHLTKPSGTPIRRE